MKATRDDSVVLGQLLQQQKCLFSVYGSLDDTVLNFPLSDNSIRGSTTPQHAIMRYVDSGRILKTINPQLHMISFEHLDVLEGKIINNVDGYLGMPSRDIEVILSRPYANDAESRIIKTELSLKQAFDRIRQSSLQLARLHYKSSAETFISEYNDKGIELALAEKIITRKTLPAMKKQRA